jgi:predicted dehydrogenase
MGTINWGIIGLGRIAEKFAHDLQFVSNAKLYGVASREKNKAEEFRIKYNVEKAYGSYEEMLQDANIDVVYIATPHVMHAVNTIASLNAGKAVLCEKPFAMNKLEVQAMVDIARQKNLFLMEAIWTRFLPTFLKVEHLIAERVIGDIVQIKSDFGYQAVYDTEWRLFNKKLGGGSLLDIGIYPVFLTLQLLGKPENIITSAVIGKTGVDESWFAGFTYKNGATASLCSTFMANTPVETDICGTKGRIKMHRMWHCPSYLTLTMNDGAETVFKFDVKGFGYEYEAQEVTNCLLAGRKESALLPLSFSMSLMEMLDDIRERIGLHY